MDVKYLFILNDPPYGNERVYNSLRLAISLAKSEGVSIRIFLMGDAVLCGRSGQVQAFAILLFRRRDK
ncbi:MAG: DsrE family protein [Armatimonadota bacterium]|nr:DsrE family protein [Armatimonadota bacterium]MDR5703860.1 DsrE family protein [Armatimonadota bacterium]